MACQPRRITLVTSHLRLGGAERAMSSMANYWIEKGWDVSLITLNKADDEQFYKLHRSVKKRHAYWARSNPTALERLDDIVKRFYLLRKTIIGTHPDIVISFLDKTNVRVLLAVAGLKLPVIVGERSNPYHMKLPKIWDWLRNFTYRGSACVVAQTERALHYFPAVIREKGRVIPNHVSITQTGDILPEIPEGKERHIIGMGRLSHEKGFPRLIEAFSRIAPKHPDWVLTIWGDGPDRESLVAQVEAFGMGGRIRLPGKTQDVFAVFKQAEMFVLPSHHEGYPNALCEAMASGLAVISFDCPNGPREIIRDGIDGILVPPDDVHNLGEAMDRLMCHKEERMRLATRAPEILERLNQESIMRQWESLIDLILRNNK